jgi:hypothetical protein
MEQSIHLEFCSKSDLQFFEKINVARLYSLRFLIVVSVDFLSYILPFILFKIVL